MSIEYLMETLKVNTQLKLLSCVISSMMCVHKDNLLPLLKNYNIQNIPTFEMVEICS